MRQQFSALCTVTGGKLKLQDEPSFYAAMAQFGDGEEVELHIETVGQKRTHAQNRFFHGPILKAFADPYGGAVRAKTELCLLFLPQEHVRPDGSVVIVPGHTSTLTVREFNDFIDHCLLLASENDVYIEDADEWRARRSAA